MQTLLSTRCCSFWQRVKDTVDQGRNFTTRDLIKPRRSSQRNFHFSAALVAHVISIWFLAWMFISIARCYISNNASHWQCTSLPPEWPRSTRSHFRSDKFSCFDFTHPVQAQSRSESVLSHSNIANSTQFLVNTKSLGETWRLLDGTTRNKPGWIRCDRSFGSSRRDARHDAHGSTMKSPRFAHEKDTDGEHLSWKVKSHHFSLHALSVTCGALQNHANLEILCFRHIDLHLRIFSRGRGPQDRAKQLNVKYLLRKPDVTNIPFPAHMKCKKKKFSWSDWVGFQTESILFTVTWKFHKTSGDNLEPSIRNRMRKKFFTKRKISVSVHHFPTQVLVLKQPSCLQYSPLQNCTFSLAETSQSSDQSAQSDKLPAF